MRPSLDLATSRLGLPDVAVYLGRPILACSMACAQAASVINRQATEPSLPSGHVPFFPSRIYISVPPATREPPYLPNGQPLYPFICRHGFHSSPAFFDRAFLGTGQILRPFKPCSTTTSAVKAREPSSFAVFGVALRIDLR
jgi:hypothetical protein